MKQRSKQFLSLILAVIMVFGMVPLTSLPVIAGSPAAVVPMTLAASEEGGMAGTDVNVKLTLKDNPGISSIRVNVSFDSSILTLNSVTYNAEMGGQSLQPQTMKSPVTLTWVSPFAECDMDTTFATLNFTISETAESNISSAICLTYDPEDIYNMEEVNVATVTVDGSVTVLSCIPGDINGDMLVNNKDITRMFQYMANWDVEVNEGTLDTNGDGSVNNKDLTRLFQFLAGWEVELFCHCKMPHTCRHELQATAAKAATCTEDGNTAYWHCTVCGKYFSDEDATVEISLDSTVIGMLGHTYSDEWTYDSTYHWHAATCGHTNMVDSREEHTFGKDNICTVCGAGNGVDPSKPYQIKYLLTEYNENLGDTYIKTQSIDNSGAVTCFSENDSFDLPGSEDIKCPGYAFDGWFTADGIRITRIEEGTKASVTVYAHWTEKQYSVTYKLYQTPVSSIIDDKYTKYTVSKGLPDLPNPTINNYIFLGWYLDDGTEMTNIPVGTTGEITMNAYWTTRRNLTKSVGNLKDPIICEDGDNGVIYFAYELGTIENVPLTDAIWEVDSVYGLSQQKSVTTEVYLSADHAQSISENISKITVDSATWSLSQDWDDSVTVNNEWATQHGLEVDKAKENARTSEGTISISSANGGNSSTTKTDGTTTVAYDSKNVTHESEHEDGAKFDVSLNVVVGSVDAGAYYNYTTKNGSNVHSGTDTTNVDTKVTNTTSSWNNSETTSETQRASESEAIKTALSEIISSTKGYGKTYSSGGESSDTHEYSSTENLSKEATSTFSYTTAKKTVTTDTYSADGKLEGSYRLVYAGTVHVFGVVGYDVATKSYFTYTYSVLDDAVREFLDYAPKTHPNFDDKENENGVLPFEIPYFVYEYVALETAMTSGLSFRTNTTNKTATILNYDGDSTDITIPAFISSGNTSYKVTGFLSNAFAGKPIRAISLSHYIDEIPTSAFKGCDKLEEVSGCFTKIGKEAFSGCVNLDGFTVSKFVSSIGTDAFYQVPSVTVHVISAFETAKAMLPETKDVNLELLAVTDEEKAKELIQMINEVAVELPLSQDIITAVTNCGAKKIVVDISNVVTNTVLTILVPSVDRFELQGGYKSYSDLQLISLADTTVLKEFCIKNCTRNPLIIESQNVVLEAISVFSPTECLLLKNDSPTIMLKRDTVLVSENGIAMVCRNITVKSDKVDAVYGTLDVSGDIYIYGTKSGIDNIRVVDGAIKDDITINQYNQYINGTYQIIFNPNGGSVNETQRTAFLNTPIGTLPTPTRTDYKFDGWYTEPTGGTKVTESSIFTSSSDLTLYAHWSKLTYTLTFNPNGGTVSPSSKTVTMGEVYGTLPTPTRDYYNFNGWYTAPSGGSKISSSTKMDAGDTTVYAQWTLKPLSGWVSEVPSGGEVIEERWTYTKTETKESTLPPESMSGWTLTGSNWKEIGSGSTNYATFPSGFDTNNTYYKNFAKSPYIEKETETTKRVVTNSWAGYIYWHWTYASTPYAINFHRRIADQYCHDNYGGWDMYCFYAIASSMNCPVASETGYVAKYSESSEPTTYDCRSIIPSNVGEYIDGLVTPRMFRFDYYTSTYKDYQKIFQYKKVTNGLVSETEISNGGQISNVQKQVRYRPK